MSLTSRWEGWLFETRVRLSWAAGLEVGLVWSRCSCKRSDCLNMWEMEGRRNSRLRIGVCDGKTDDGLASERSRGSVRIGSRDGAMVSLYQIWIQ